MEGRQGGCDYIGYAYSKQTNLDCPLTLLGKKKRVGVGGGGGKGVRGTRRLDENVLCTVEERGKHGIIYRLEIKLTSPMNPDGRGGKKEGNRKSGGINQIDVFKDMPGWETLWVVES